MKKDWPKWEELSEDHKNKWTDLAIKIEFIKEMKECCSCKKKKTKFPNGIMYYKIKDAKFTFGINGDYLFHMQSTHGIYPELLIEEFEKRFNKQWYPT